MGAWVLDYVAAWAGEYAYITHSNIQYRSPALEGDVTYLDGNVIGKRIGRDGKPHVDLEMTMRSQTRIRARRPSRAAPRPLIRPLRRRTRCRRRPRRTSRHRYRQPLDWRRFVTMPSFAITNLKQVEDWGEGRWPGIEARYARRASGRNILVSATCGLTRACVRREPTAISTRRRRTP